MLLADLQPASFRGVRFLVPKDSWEEGRNAIDHQYPDSSHRYVEDNGLIPPKFKVTAILHGPNLRGQLSALRSALTRPGPGSLRHPYFGSQYVMVDGTYKGDREDADGGVIKLEIPFIVTGSPIFPGIVSGIPAAVSGLASQALSVLATRMVDALPSDMSAYTREVLTAAVSSIVAAPEASFGTSEQIIPSVAGIIDDGDRFAAKLDDFLAAPMEDDTISVDRLVLGYRAVSDAAALVSAEALAINVTTQERADRQAALYGIGTLTEAAAFARLSESLAARAYKRAEQVETDESDLVARWETLQSRQIAADVHDALADVMIAVSEVLRDQEVRLPRVTQQDVVLLPASVLAYQLYDSDVRTMALADINPGKNPMILNGNVNVLID